MNKIIIIALCLLCNGSKVGAQETQTKGSCKSLPMKSGTISIATAQDEKTSHKLMVSSPESAVYSLTSGEVMQAMKVTDPTGAIYNVVIVQYKTDSLVSYARLDDILVKKGDAVKKGQMIARATRNASSGKNEVEVSVFSRENGQKGVTPIAAPVALAFMKKSDS